MARCLTDLSPRWIVYFKRNDLSFAIKFNEVYEMISACTRARALGFSIKTMAIPWEAHRMFEELATENKVLW